MNDEHYATTGADLRVALDAITDNLPGRRTGDTEHRKCRVKIAELQAELSALDTQLAAQLGQTVAASASASKPWGQKAVAADAASEVAAPKTAKTLRRMGLDPKYAGITNEGELREMEAERGGAMNGAPVTPGQRLKHTEGAAARLAAQLADRGAIPAAELDAALDEIATEQARHKALQMVVEVGLRCEASRKRKARANRKPSTHLEVQARREAKAKGVFA